MSKKDIHYFRAKFLDEKVPHTLQEYLTMARKALPTAADREQQFGGEDGIQRLWNQQHVRGNLLCGMFHSWEKGKNQLIITKKEKVSEYPVAAKPAPAGGSDGG